MTEFINILIFPVFLFLMFSNSFLIRINNNKFKSALSITDLYVLNIFIILNIILLFFLFNLKINYVIYFLILYFFSTNIFLLDKNILKNNKSFILSNFVIIIIFYVFAFEIVANPNLSWDGKFHWYLKSLNFYQDLGIRNLYFLPKYEYPHFGTFLWALFWKFNAIQHEYFGRLFYLFLYLLSIISFVEIFETNRKNKIIIFAIISIISFNHQNFFGNQDILVFSLVVFLSKYIYLIFEKKNDVLLNYILIFLISNIILWIKYESFIFVLISYFMILISKYLLKQRKLFIITLASIMIILLMKLTYNIIYDVNLKPTFQFSGEYEFIQFLNLILIIKKSIFIFKYFLISLFKNPILLIGFLFMFLPLFDKRLASKEVIISFILFNLSTFFIFFIIQNDFKWHVINGIDRYVLQYSGYSLIFIALYLNKYIFKS